MPGPDFRIVGMRTLVYHEAVPGHHFQIAPQQENMGLPRYRRDRVFASGSAYVEGWALYAEQLASEVERYVVMPGQACAYKIGMIRILDLRAKAEKALGDKFSIKGFHNTVLHTGDVPLSVLEKGVDEWIATQKG